jgi:hypothetical protein
MAITAFTKGKTGKNMKLQVELSQIAYLAEVFTADATRKIFSTANMSTFSLFEDATVNRTPVMKVDGTKTGGVVVPAVSATNDAVDTSAVVSWIGGAEVSVAASTDDTITRDGALAYIIHSVTQTAAGAIAILGGTAHASAFVETRGSAGGPPYIPVTSIELAQIRTTSITAAPITTAEIFAVPNIHREVSAIPFASYDVTTATINFEEALMPAHTGDVPKKVAADVYAPTSFTTLQGITAFTLPGETPASNSQQTPDGTSVAADPSTLENGSLSVLTDLTHQDLPSIIDGTTATFKWWPDKNGADYYLGIAAMSGRATTPISGGQYTLDMTLIPRIASIRLP